MLSASVCTSREPIPSLSLPSTNLEFYQIYRRLRVGVSVFRAAALLPSPLPRQLSNYTAPHILQTTEYTDSLTHSLAWPQRDPPSPTLGHRMPQPRRLLLPSIDVRSRAQRLACVVQKFCYIGCESAPFQLVIRRSEKGASLGRKGVKKNPFTTRKKL